MLHSPSASRSRAPNQLQLDWIRERIAAHRARPIDARVAPRRAAVATVLRDLTGELELLFIRRAKQDGDPWSGHMAFPGGRKEPSDTDVLETALRETREELGLDLTAAAELLGRLDDIIASARGRVLPLAITPFVFALRQDVLLTPDPAEVQQALWIPVSMLLSPAHSSTMPYELRGERYHLPCFRVNERIVWGLTYQMLMRMFAVLQWEIGV